MRASGAAKVSGMRARASQLAAYAAFDAAAAVVGAHTQVDPRDLRRRGGRLLRARPVAEARRVGLYLAVVAFNRPGREIARVVGVSHEAVRKALRLVEDKRDDEAFDAWLATLEQELMT